MDDNMFALNRELAGDVADTSTSEPIPRRRGNMGERKPICAAVAGGSLDSSSDVPACGMPTEELLKQLSMETSSVGSDHACLVDELKAWQSSSLSRCQAWRSYCEQHGDGHYNPSAYSEAFLRRALAELDDWVDDVSRR